MKYFQYFVLVCLLSFTTINGQEHVFSEKSLNDTLLTLEGEDIQFKTIIDQHLGSMVLIDIWATWCKDCIVGMPIVKQLKMEYPKVKFVYISLDRTIDAWKKGIKRFGIEEGSHYWVEKGWKADLFETLDLDWIPRYMILDELGNIKLYKAIKASDKEIVKQLKG